MDAPASSAGVATGSSKCTLEDEANAVARRPSLEGRLDRSNGEDNNHDDDDDDDDDDNDGDDDNEREETADRAWETIGVPLGIPEDALPGVVGVCNKRRNSVGNGLVVQGKYKNYFDKPSFQWVTLTRINQMIDKATSSMNKGAEPRVADKRVMKSLEMGNLVARLIEALISDNDTSLAIYGQITMASATRRHLTAMQMERSAHWNDLSALVGSVRFSPPARLETGVDPSVAPASPYKPSSGNDVQVLLRQIRQDVMKVKVAFEASGQNESTLDEMNERGTTMLNGHGDYGAAMTSDGAADTSAGAYGDNNAAMRSEGADGTRPDAGAAAFKKVAASCKLNAESVMYVARLLLEKDHGVSSKVGNLLDSRAQSIDDVDVDVDNITQTRKRARITPMGSSNIGSLMSSASNIINTRQEALLQSKKEVA
ncbi:Hypothetical Protein FCC1311_099132 [Hondaea fermentalgiana]|uniref:Uncharacterized protein n=1 Tax=Hondaea fermentalgiana TaxID=2315210 RepID=A0A2R5GS65_9STRA|nr:Hypothetical Protein FCC1311_099132 [Hondaea fermentalgiana]|eukprot:GBG33690.1 Hypothetical Protein FCC1311_099132 [Hondaea fermentalgiana]